MKTLDIQRNSDVHKHISRALTARVSMSQAAMSDRRKEWRRNEEDYLAYLPMTGKEKEKENSREKIGYTKVMVPYNYSVLMTAHTYFCGTLLGRSPVFQYTGAHGEPEMNSLAVQSLVAYQMREQGNLACLYLWLMDTCKYGLGITCDYWEEEMHYVTEIEEVSPTFAGMPMPGRKKVKRVTREIPGYEGNKLFNISPYDYIPDTRVPLSNPQQGEFQGRFLELSYNDVVTGKLQGRFIAENADYVLEHMEKAQRAKEHEMSSQIVMPGDSAEYSGVDPKTGLGAHILAVELVVTIIPKLWHLGSMEYPEKWVFTMTYSDKNGIADTVLSVRPYGMYHNRFPFHVLEIEMDPYSLFKRSFLDIARPLNTTLTWLFNSHFYAVERSLNGEYVFDPTKVYAADVMDRKPGKRIRLKPSAYGTDVRAAIQTLQPGADVTQSHMRDMGGVMELLQQTIGVSEGMLGNLPSGRQSATATRVATAAGTSRLKTVVDYFAATGFLSLANNLCQSAQQLYTGQQKFRIAGDIPNNVENFLEVNPEILAGNFEYIPVDGAMPMDRVATVNMWIQMLGQFRQFPQLAQRYDMAKIVGWVMQQGGIKNLKQFEVQTMSPEVMAAEAAKGNAQPIDTGGGYGDSAVGRNGGAGAGRTEEDIDRISAQTPNPGQTGGMGRST